MYFDGECQLLDSELLRCIHAEATSPTGGSQPETKDDRDAKHIEPWEILDSRFRLGDSLITQLNLPETVWWWYGTLPSSWLPWKS